MTTETLEQFRARMKRELSAANNQHLLTEAKAVQQTRGWDFTRAWDHVLAENPSMRQGIVQGRLCQDADVGLRTAYRKRLEGMISDEEAAVLHAHETDTLQSVLCG